MGWFSLRRRTVHVLLSVLGLFLLGTVVVLSTVSYYLSIPVAAYITEQELNAPIGIPSWNASQHGKVERIPRILHQTWKTDVLPDRWKQVSQECRAMMPDYEYMLWTDEGSRNFIAEEYSWFLDTFDSYIYPIQRADAIRYFVLHHYGGVYLDLDIGCLRRVDPLLVFPVILPRTIPVGVSNDLMFAEKGHPFMAQTIHNLVTFDHDWVLNYPTVMFSTGPMFLSTQYGLYSASHPSTPALPGGEVRILPKSLYGKNAKDGEAPHSFFTHFYGSSWHSDDAAFIGFLGKWGKVLLWVGLVVLVLSMIRLGYTSTQQMRPRSAGGYDVVLPRWVERNGRWHLDLGWLSLPGRMTPATSPTIPHDISNSMAGLTRDDDDVPLLPLPLNVRSVSPAPSSRSSNEEIMASSPPVTNVLRRLRNDIASFLGISSRDSRRRPRGVLFFLPAFASSGGDIALPNQETLSSSGLIPRRSPNSSDKRSLLQDVEADAVFQDAFSDGSSASMPSHSELAFRLPADPDASGARRPYAAASTPRVGAGLRPW
ncbi:glycosyltransferase family 32 protein [Auriscalpium vulgare]|uniref:Glycosyltransferase family 32 protein n=1 Tax=Auriscalpium vulgare TaxID=40419 RepID=A0ACB8SAQ0_9AGAM|nr:glycosyltransferase family 32 protein [Auriscalpium vulgare]